MMSPTLWKTVLITIGVIFACDILQTNAQAFLDGSSLETFLKQSYSQLILKYKSEMEKDPQRSAQCFKEYAPKLNKVTKELEEANRKCVKAEETALNQVPKQVAQQRANLTNTVAIICNKFTECTLIEHALDFFRCYECVANDGINVAHWMGLNGKEGAKMAEISYDVISYKKQQCVNGATTAFLNANTKNQNELDDCINGLPRCKSKPTPKGRSISYDKDAEERTVDGFLRHIKV